MISLKERLNVENDLRMYKTQLSQLKTALEGLKDRYNSESEWFNAQMAEKMKDIEKLEEKLGLNQPKSKQISAEEQPTKKTLPKRGSK
jgi:ppGpp synthetase/RelA/SpoT-type nucleotidyltranferase